MAAVVVKVRKDWMEWEESDAWYSTVDVIVCAVGTTRYLRTVDRRGLDQLEIFQIGPTGVIVDL